MSKLQIPKPKNQWALAIYLLAKSHKRGLTIADAIKSDLFYKFGNRVNEVNNGRESKLLLRKLPMKFKNRFGHPGSHTNYKSLAPLPYLVNLIKKLNKVGKKAINLPPKK